MTFWHTTAAVLLGNLLTAAVLGLGGLAYVATQTDDPVPTARAISSACLDTLTKNSGQMLAEVPANCAGDDSQAVADRAAELGVIMPIQEGNS